MIISAHHFDRTMLSLRSAGGSSPIQLAQCQLPRSVIVKLVGNGVHWPARCVDMDVGQPEQPLQRTLFDAYGLGLGMRHDVAYMCDPAMLGDQSAIVPAIVQRPEVEPP